MDSPGASTNRVRKTFVLLGSLGSAGFTTPMIFAITQTFAGSRAAGQWYGLQAIAGQSAGIIAPIVTGLIVEGTGQFAWAFVTAAIVLLIGAFAWGLIVPRIEPILWPADLASRATIPIAA
jgi:hypothetical protein